MFKTSSGNHLILPKKSISYHRILPYYHSGYSLVLSFSPELSKFVVELQAPTILGIYGTPTIRYGYENGCQNCHNITVSHLFNQIEFQQKITTHVCCIVAFFLAKMLSVTLWLFNMDMVQMSHSQMMYDDLLIILKIVIFHG